MFKYAIVASCIFCMNENEHRKKFISLSGKNIIFFIFIITKIMPDSACCWSLLSLVEYNF